jgi:hypothetical protein
MPNTLNNKAVANLLRQAGFDEATIPRMVSIANAESSLNPRAHNPNAATGDNSYGLFQINMLGGMGNERRKNLGLKSNEALFDPLTNARAAKAIYDQQGLGAWSVHRSGAANKFTPTAEEIGPSIINPDAFLEGYKGNVTTQIPDGYSGAVTVNNYYGDGTETQQKKNKNLTETLFTSLLNQQNKSSDFLDLLLKPMSLGGPGSGKLYPLSLPIFNQLN